MLQRSGQHRGADDRVACRGRGRGNARSILRTLTLDDDGA
jgi:hypothetical protein